MKIITKSLFLCSILAISSCATIISGSRQMVEIDSDPIAATVYINEIEIGKTPVKENLKRDQEYQLVLKMEGYKTYEAKLERKFNAWYIGNIAFGGFVGLIVDPITGAMYKLKPEEVDGEMKKGTNLKMEGGNIFLKISMEADADREKVGQVEKAE